MKCLSTTWQLNNRECPLSILKETGEIVVVLDAYINPVNHKCVVIECDDKNTYYHDEIK